MKIQGRHTLTGTLSPPCDLDLEDNNAILLHATFLAINTNVPSLVRKSSEVEKMQGEHALTANLNPPFDVDLKDNSLTF